MPLYEYRCEDCENEFEEMLHFSEREDPINEPCPSCKGKIHLKMSMGSFHLKGGGWYKDGYGTTQKKKKRTHHQNTTGGVTEGRSLGHDD